MAAAVSWDGKVSCEVPSRQEAQTRYSDAGTDQQHAHRVALTDPEEEKKTSPELLLRLRQIKQPVRW